MTGQGISLAKAEVGTTLLQAGLSSITGRPFTIQSATDISSDLTSFREALVARAVREKMMPMLDAYSRQRDLGLGTVPSRLTEVYRIIAREQYRHLRPALDLLAQREIPVVLIKGGDLDLNVYQKAFPRVMGDIDILIRPPDADQVMDVFRSQGFIQGALNQSRLEIVPLSDAEKAEIEEESIELAEFAKLISVPDLIPLRDVITDHLAYWRMIPLQGDYYLVVGYDIHIHLSLEIDIQDVWCDLRTIESPETGRCFAQSFTDMAWYLTVRFYHELHINNAFVMRSFLDVLAIVFHHHKAIDWERIDRMARKYSLQPALFYCFWHINELIGPLIPSALLESLCPVNTGTERGHDWGDFIPKMLGGVQLTPILKLPLPAPGA